jgi:hypothetical protein
MLIFNQQKSHEWILVHSLSHRLPAPKRS